MTSFLIPEYPELRQIPLSQGQFAIVDVADYEWLNQWRWFASPGRVTVYAMRHDKIDGKNRVVQMHRAPLSTPRGMWVDHRNGNGLEYYRKNLRLCTPRHKTRLIEKQCVIE